MSLSLEIRRFEGRKRSFQKDASHKIMKFACFNMGVPMFSGATLANKVRVPI